MIDNNFISGDFLFGDLPPNKDYFQYYFKGDAEKAFVSYYYFFPEMFADKLLVTSYNNFCDHTGICCSIRWVGKLLTRIHRIEQTLDKAEKDFDINLIGDIKSGNYSFK